MGQGASLFPFQGEKQDNPPCFGKMGWVFLDMKDADEDDAFYARASKLDAMPSMR